MAALRRAALISIFTLHLSGCWCEAEFELFPGFNLDDDIDVTSSTTITTTKPTIVVLNNTITSTTTRKPTLRIVTKLAGTSSTSTKRTVLGSKSAKTKLNTIRPPTTVSPEPFVCPEEESPSNIGPYEVPSQRDLVNHIKKTLRNSFSRYHKNALFFLNDIKGATRATREVENKCPSRSKATYKRCVKHVSNQCQVITKSLVVSLERQRHDVAAFTEGSICNMTSMNADPVQLIKILAMEEASLEFALSGFLRLLSACEYYCRNDHTTTHRMKPKRHMTDQDLVIRHFLTRKNYIQLLKGTP